MAATVLIREKNTVGETATDKTAGTIRLKQADNATVDNVNPVPKPAAGVQRTFEKWLRLNLSVAPTGDVSNPQFYVSGSPGTGITYYVRTTNPGVFATPATPANDASGTDMTTYNSGARKDMDAVNAGPFTGTGDKGDYLVMWATVGTTVTAPQNPTANMTLTFTYDET
jgi:hypothetical protein